MSLVDVITVGVLYGSLLGVLGVAVKLLGGVACGDPLFVWRRALAREHYAADEGAADEGAADEGAADENWAVRRRQAVAGVAMAVAQIAANVGVLVFAMLQLPGEAVFLDGFFAAVLVFIVADVVALGGSAAGYPLARRRLDAMGTVTVISTRAAVRERVRGMAATVHLATDLMLALLAGLLAAVT